MQVSGCASHPQTITSIKQYIGKGLQTQNTSIMLIPTTLEAPLTVPKFRDVNFWPF